MPEGIISFEPTINSFDVAASVSYTHLDVYKRQQQIHQGGNVWTTAHVRIIDSCCCPIADEQGKFHRLQKHTYLGILLMGQFTR